MAIFRIPVTLQWPQSGSPGVNVFHLRTTEASGTPGNDLIIDDALDVLGTFLHAAYDANSAFGFTWSVGTGIVDVATQQEINRTPQTGGQGFNQENAPPVLALCVAWRTSLAARRGRGRTFIGPFAKGVMDADGTPTTAYFNALNAAVDTFVANSQAIAGGAFAIYGQETAGVPEPKVARDIVSGQVKDKFAVLRSRRD